MHLENLETIRTPVTAVMVAEAAVEVAQILKHWKE